MRKKRLITMIVLVVFCALFLTVTAYILMRKDTEEYIKWQAQYKGVWVSSDGKYEMTVRRVTSAHVIFSLCNKERNLSLDYACAAALEEGQYSFQYDLSRRLVGTVTAEYGKKGSGTIRLQDESVVLDVGSIEGFKNNNLTFQGTLKKKGGLPEVNRTELQTMMGKNRPGDYSESKSPYVLEEEGNKVNRIHITWDSDRKKDSYEGYEINGINSLCLLSDLESEFGDPIEEEGLERNRYRRIYEKDGYRYWFITNGYGLVVEGDCQYQIPERGRREGDFLMDGDTIIRYAGDYEINRKIFLPEGTKRIASGAFTIPQNLCPVEYICSTELSIPKDVVVEKDAFRNCGRMRLALEEGWTSVPAEAFAHMVEEGTLSGKSNWVEVTLPSSLRRLEERAFETKWYDETVLVDYMDSEILGVQPVTVYLDDELEYIGDNALYGIMNSKLPDNVKYLGENFQLFAPGLDSVQVGISSPTEKFEDRGTVIPAYILTVPEQLEEAADNGLLLKVSQGFEEDEYNCTVIVKIPEKCKTVPHLLNRYVIGYEEEKGNRHFSTKNGWLYSKDGKVLYGTTCRVDYDGKTRDSNFRFYRADSQHLANRTEIYVPEGVEEIAEYALSEFIGESFEDTFTGKSDIWAPIEQHQYVLPKSLRRIARNALFSLADDGDYYYQVKITGDVPQFYGEFPEDCKFHNKIYVRNQDRKKFIRNLTKGQELTEEQKTNLEKCIVGY